MWALRSLFRCATMPVVGNSFEALGLRISASSFHSLTGCSSKPSPLTNQCSREAITVQHLLQPPPVPLLSLACGFKVKGRLKRRCKDCYFVMRQERLYVICKTHPRHKQMSMKKHDRNTWILTDATQSKVRAW